MDARILSFLKTFFTWICTFITAVSNQGGSWQCWKIGWLHWRVHLEIQEWLNNLIRDQVDDPWRQVRWQQNADWHGHESRGNSQRIHWTITKFFLGHCNWPRLGEVLKLSWAWNSQSGTLRLQVVKLDLIGAHWLPCFTLGHLDQLHASFGGF